MEVRGKEFRTMRWRIRKMVVWVRSRLLYRPAIFVVLSILLAFVAPNLHFPAFLGVSGVSAASARVILTTTAGATVTVAALIFSSPLRFTSNQYSLRLRHGFLGDPVSQLVIGLVMGTFAYSLILLSSVEGPSVSAVAVTISVLLAAVSLLRIMVYVDHTARVVQISHILKRIAASTRNLVDYLLPYAAGEAPPVALPASQLPQGDGYTVRSTQDGWVTAIDDEILAGEVSDGSVIRVDVRAGTQVVDRMPLCKVWPAPDDCAMVAARMRQAFLIVHDRSAGEDIGVGLHQMKDVAVQALAVNDALTVDTALGAIAGVLSDLLQRHHPPRVREVDGRRIYRPQELAPTAYVNLAFDHIRVAGAAQPDICVALLSTLAGLNETLTASQLPERTEALRHQAQRIVDSADQACRIAEDRDRVRKAAEDLGLVG